MFLINIRPDVGWGFSLDFCSLIAFQESLFFNSRSFPFSLKCENFMSFSSLCAATKYIVLSNEYHDQKQKPA